MDLQYPVYLRGKKKSSTFLLTWHFQWMLNCFSICALRTYPSEEGQRGYFLSVSWPGLFSSWRSVQEGNTWLKPAHHLHLLTWPQRGPKFKRGNSPPDNEMVPVLNIFWVSEIVLEPWTVLKTTQPVDWERSCKAHDGRNNSEAGRATSDPAHPSRIFFF